MPEQEKSLTPKQQQCALLLASGKSIVDAAVEISVNESTIRRWKVLEAFRAAVAHAEDDLYSEVLSRLKREAANAVDCLVRNLNEDAAAPYVQVQAAAKILDASLQAAKVRELETLLSELEARLQE